MLDPSGHPGWENMARDEGLLDLADQGAVVLRLYRWSPPCLSFGRNEPALRRYDRDQIQSLGIDTVRRPTGGRAVWHADELTYAMAAPLAAFGTLVRAYSRLHELLATALTRLGVPARVAPAPSVPAGLASGACFARTAGGEVVIGGRKVVGSAQVRRRDAFLQHGSLLLAGDQQLVTQVTRGAAPPDQSVSLSPIVRPPVTYSEAAAVIVEAARASFGPEAAYPPREPVDQAARTHRSRFQSDAWTSSR